MDKPMKIVVLDGAVINPGDISWQPLATFGDLAVYDWTNPEELAERAKDADIVVVNKTVLGAEEVAALKKCRLVAALATGVNNLDLDALQKAGIAVCNVTAYGVEEVAQHALALLLEICNNVGAEAGATRAGEWHKRNIWCYWQRTPICLAGKTMGIIGFGAIGQASGRLANALGMRVLASSPARRAKPDWQPFAYAENAEIFARADVISLHCPLTPKTDKIINAESISKMKRGAIIINTARGGLIDELAAAAALHSGHLGGLGADVLACEPPTADNPLLSAPNTFITPHMAWAGATARQRIIDITAGNIRRWLAGKEQNRII